MAKYNKSMSVTFNDNDGGVGWSANPETSCDLVRHHVIFGKWRARWIFFKRFWRAMVWLENYSKDYYPEMNKAKSWVFKSEIPE